MGNHKLSNEINHLLEKIAQLPEGDPSGVGQAKWDEFRRYARRSSYSLDNQVDKNGDLSDLALKLFRDLQRKVGARNPRG